MAKKTDPLTPEDLVRAVFHGNKEAVLRSVGRTAHERLRRQIESDKKAGKQLKRHFKRSDRGKIVLEEEIITPKKPKKPATKKAKKG